MAAADTACQQRDNALLHERPANSLHEPSGGPSTSNGSSQPEFAYSFVDTSQESGTALPHTAHADSGRSFATQQGTDAVADNPSAAKIHAASSQGPGSAAKPNANDRAEPEVSISTTSNTHKEHSTNSSRGGNTSSSSKEAASHIDWDKDDAGSHVVAARDTSSSTDDPVHKLTAASAQQKPYIVLSVKLKNGKVSSWPSPQPTCLHSAAASPGIPAKSCSQWMLSST